ncbi:hypothetical protein ABB27_09185 [Stenotrophomonas terrae]|uniref:Uncharacterized protein n=1 Tax=Stenotrophomonas terrae TaxID=405446 RepID=A0A0R0CDC0_9GAMM|nr:hypothetical protein [Stenotrophomonas terrae]KRG67725.1 hypothetical protein ABB27_09185 [Stenotrophomonas terrae]
MQPNPCRWLLALACALAMLAQVAGAEPSNKWRIAVNHTADVAGEIELSLTPEGAEATRLVVPIPAGTHENHAAHLIRDAFRSQYGRSLYKAEMDDGEDVLIKVRGQNPDIDLVLVRNTAEGLKLHLSRE